MLHERLGRFWKALRVLPRSGGVDKPSRVVRQVLWSGVIGKARKTIIVFLRVFYRPCLNMTKKRLVPAFRQADRLNPLIWLEKVCGLMEGIPPVGDYLNDLVGFRYELKSGRERNRHQ